MTKKIDNLIVISDHAPELKKGSIRNKTFYLEFNPNNGSEASIFYKQARRWMPKLLRAVKELEWKEDLNALYRCRYCDGDDFHDKPEVEHKPGCIALLLEIVEVKK